MTTLENGPPSPPQDFQLAVHTHPGDTYEWSKVLLAKAHCDGRLEFLTAAWGRMLGYGGQEFAAKTLRQLMRSGKPAAANVVAAILDETTFGPVDVNLRCRNGRNKWLRLHRRYDGYEHAMFIVGEEPSATLRRRL